VRTNGAGEGLTPAASGDGEGEEVLSESGAAVVLPDESPLCCSSDGDGGDTSGCWGASGLGVAGGGLARKLPELPPVAAQMRVGRPAACSGALPAVCKVAGRG
jgi:hypothetical protein